MLSEPPVSLCSFLLSKTLQVSHSEAKITLSWNFSGLLEIDSRKRLDPIPHPSAVLTSVVSMDEASFLSHPPEQIRLHETQEEEYPPPSLKRMYS